MSLNRFELAKKVVGEIQKEVKSCHSIISEIDLPFLFSGEIKTYEKQFGKAKIAEVLAFGKKRLKIRELLSEELPDLGRMSDTVKMEIATALCGNAECGEQTFYAMAKFLIEDYPEDVNYIILKSFINDREYNHAFLVLGNNFDFNTIEDFKSLSDKFILVDPKLGIVCQLNTALETEPLFKKYLEIYQLENRTMLHVFNIAQKEFLLQIVAEATKASEKVKKKLSINTLSEAKTVTAPAFSLGSDGTPIQDELKRITEKNWQYYPPKGSRLIPKALFISTEQTEVDEIIKLLKKQGLTAKKQITNGTPVQHVAVIDEPKLDLLKQISTYEPKVKSELSKTA